MQDNNHSKRHWKNRFPDLQAPPWWPAMATGSHAAAWDRQTLDHVISAFRVSSHHMVCVVNQKKKKDVSNLNSQKPENGCLAEMANWHFSHVCAPLALQVKLCCFIVLLPISVQNASVFFFKANRPEYSIFRKAKDIEAKGIRAFSSRWIALRNF